MNNLETSLTVDPGTNSQQSARTIPVKTCGTGIASFVSSATTLGGGIVSVDSPDFVPPGGMFVFRVNSKLANSRVVAIKINTKRMREKEEVRKANRAIRRSGQE